eukprot:3788477-Rhodomonas_salina.1
MGEREIGRRRGEVGRCRQRQRHTVPHSPTQTHTDTRRHTQTHSHTDRQTLTQPRTSVSLSHTQRQRQFDDGAGCVAGGMTEEEFKSLQCALSSAAPPPSSSRPPSSSPAVLLQPDAVSGKGE